LHGVISSYNNSPEKLVGYFDSFSIYDQSDDQEIAKRLAAVFPHLVATKNSGHSLSHYFAYIIENYHQLPEYIVFLKSNVIPRHIDIQTFEKCIFFSKLNNGYVSFFNDKKFEDKIRIAYHIYPGLFFERNNSWYMKRVESRYFKDFNQLLNFLFIDPKVPEFVPFTPGACFGVLASQVERIPLGVWKFLEEITTYKYFPSEAYLVERVLFILLHAPYDFQSYFLNDSEAWKLKLNLLREERRNFNRTKVNPPQFLKVRTHLYSLLVKIEAKIRFELDSRF